MSDPHQDPDPAALDELLRAFGEEAEPSTEASSGSLQLDDADGVDVAGEADDEADETPGDTPALTGDPGGSVAEPPEILIVEQDPMVAPADATPTPPQIIRIDDYSGSVVASGTPVADAPPDQPPLVGGGSVVDEAVAVTDAESDGADPVVISIDDEDLPDAVYVEGALDGGGNRTIVFIEDDETGDAVAPSVDRDGRRGIEPRLRERRAAVKRAIGRKRLRWLLVGMVAVIVGVGTLALLGSGLFAIKAENVDVFGAVYADEAQVDAVIDELVGTPVLRADTRSAEKALEEIPWVDVARVRVSFPNSATVEIREREAWTTYQGPDQRYRVLDREGRVLAVLDGYPIAYLLLDGPDSVDLDAGNFAPQGYAAASELAKNLTGSIRGQVSFVSVTADGSSLTIFLDDGTEIRFGAARDLFNKLLRLETTLSNNPDLEPGVIDVSTSEVTF